MNIIAATLHKHAVIARRYPVASILVLLCCAVSIGYCTSIHKPLHGIAYISAIWLAAFITDMVTDAFPKAAIGFPIKKPVGQELFAILSCTVLGIVFLVVRFRCDWAHINRWVRLAFAPLVLFTFPVVVTLIYLFRYRYRPKELGINIRYWPVAILIHLIVGGATLIAAPEASHWEEALTEIGIPGLLVTGLITSALPEEFLRMLLQTRFAKAFRNTGMGFVTATLIWSAMHIPTESNSERTIDWPQHIIRTITLIPVGLLWGYITHRTKSLIPSVLVHGFNLWGLQNVMS